MALFYNTPGTAPWMAKRFRENELGKAYGVTSGKISPWDLPEFQSAEKDMAKARDLSLSGLARNLTRTGVTGPAAGLALENAGNGFSDKLLDYVNQIKGSYNDRGLNVGKTILDDKFRQDSKLYDIGQNWQQRHDTQPNDWEKWNKGIQQGVGTVSSIADLFLGGAGLMGKLPGQGGVSSAAGGMNGMSGLNGQNFMQMFMKLLEQQNTQRDESKAWGYR